ncbi:hypothetical protein D9619_006268 [Psilocybe cf. subviscida]|uniref:Translation machinery-associated protein 16 n=1 Tax=Psilocybe cf. subviscida TaxID=2480587 RepID=A0A8H5B500_9AGAR|nr:hypothetical protein D9619_006268 [Psilocybe cf. subviscida]
MAPANTPKAKAASAATKEKKEKLFHPASRKAGQLARHALRKGKMGNLASKRSEKAGSLVDVYGFFYHAMPEEGVLSLEDLHTIFREVWLTRYDEELASERAARRKGRPKSAKEMKLEEMKLREAETYRTGMEVIDLTHEANVKLFRTWDQKEVAFVNMLRFIRINSIDPTVAIVARPGHHFSLIGDGTDPGPDHERDATEILKKLAPRQRAQLEAQSKDSKTEDTAMDLDQS